MSFYFKFVKNINRINYILPFILFSQSLYSQKVVKYDLFVKDTIVDYAGKNKRAIAVNGQIPMPTLTFTEGDIAEITVHNQLKEPTSLHWHGLFLPNKEDGVPMLTQMPIQPNDKHTYSFPIKQNGTHWYHSHSGFQEQIGMYGSFIINKKDDDKNYRDDIDNLPYLPIIISEWTNLNPKNIQRMLHFRNDWGAVKKNSVQSYAEAIKEGEFFTKIKNEWKRMNAMDVADIYYDKILLNGLPESDIISIDNKKLKAGDRIRLRISNAGGSSYFWLRYAGGKITVVASDGNDVEPVEVDRLLIGTAETYDIVITIPENNTAYEFSVTTEDRSQSSSMYFGDGVKKSLEPLPPLKYFAGMKMMNNMMDMKGNIKDLGLSMSLNQIDMRTIMYPEVKNPMMHHPVKKSKDNNQSHNGHQMDMNSDNSPHDAHQMNLKSDNNMQHQMNKQNSDPITLNYAMLKSPIDTRLSENAPINEIELVLTGNMGRYVWSIDNKTLTESDKIKVNKGEILRIKIHNNSMMRHPMHLHGYDFRVINPNGDKSPLKNTLDIMPNETDVIEFEANEEGDWFFHCHILYHMVAGMGRVVEVGDYDNPLIKDKKAAYKKLQRMNDPFYFSIQNDFATNGNDGLLQLEKTRWAFNTEWRLGYNDKNGYEVDARFGRYIGRMQWFMPFIGYSYSYRNDGRNNTDKNIFGQKNLKDSRNQFSLGFMYTLPLLINFEAEIYTNANVRLKLTRRDIPISRHLRAGFMVDSDLEYFGELSYYINKNISPKIHYDSDMGFGIGINILY